MTKRLIEQKALLFALVDQFPPHDQFLQNFQTDFEYWAPLSWRGFTETTLYSYTLEDVSDLKATRSGISSRTRGNINKASRSLTIRTDHGTDDLYDALAATLGANRKAMPFTTEMLRHVHLTCLERNQGRVLTAHDNAGRFVAGLFFVWDDQSAYALISGATPEGRDSGAPSLLLWEAIQFAATVAGRFDFEGSSIESIERFFRSFGGSPIPYSHVEWRSRRMNALLTLRELRH